MDRKIPIVIKRIDNNLLEVSPNTLEDGIILGHILDNYEARELSIALRAMSLNPEIKERVIYIKFWTNEEWDKLLKENKDG